MTEHPKRPRGRPRKAYWAGNLLGHAYDYRMILGNSHIWRDYKEKIEAAGTPENIAKVLKTIGDPYGTKLLGLQRESGQYEGARRIAEAIKDHDWPKAEWRQVIFLADSLAASGEITARRSRQLSKMQRKRSGDSSPMEWPALVFEGLPKALQNKRAAPVENVVLR